MQDERVMLIVDDMEINRQILTELFQDDYHIVAAVDGLEAIHKIGELSDQIAMILLDIVMPNMDGIAVLKWMKENSFCDIPVVAVTSEHKYQLDALQNGAWDFISKPTENNIIHTRVQNVVSRYALNREKKRNQQLVFENREMSNLINSIPGGIATYRIVGNRFEMIYCSDGVANLSGHTKQEYEQIVGDDATSIIYSEDKKRILSAAIDTLRRGLPIDETYRVHHKDGTLVWVHLNGTIIGEENGVPIVHAVFQKPSRMAKLYDNLVNESSNIIYVCDVNNYDLLYINNAGLAAIHKEKEDYSCKKCHEFLFGYASPCPFCKISEMRKDCYLKRDFVYPVNNHVYAMRGKLTEWNGLCAHVEYVEDVTAVRAAEVRKKEWIDQLQLLMDNIPGGMCVYRADKSGFHPVVHNKAFFDIFGYSPEHQKAVLNNTNFLNVHPEDLDQLRLLVYDAVQTGKQVNHTYRCFNDIKNRYIWINLNAVVISQNGEKLCYASYTDVTGEREIQDKLVDTQQHLEVMKTQAQDALEGYRSLVNAVPGGIAQYEIVGSGIRTKFFSDGLCALTGRSKDERSAMSNESVLAVTYEPDLPALKACIAQAVRSNQNIDITYRIKTKDGSPKWVHLSAAYLPGANGEKYYQAVFTDVDNLKKAEQELQENQLRYSVAIKSSGINVWEYDIPKDSLYIVSNSARIKQNCYHIDNYSKSSIENGFVRKDSIKPFLSIFERLKNGEKEITEDIWYKTTDQAGWWCERVTYTTAFDSAGKPVKAYGAGRDVTREKEAEEKFYNEISRHKSLQCETLSSLMINLTTNQVLSITSSFQSVLCFAGQSADDYFSQTLKKITDQSAQKSFLSVFNRPALLNKFNSGNFIIPMEFTRTYDTSKVFWISYSAHLIQNPSTKDIIAYIACIDVTDDKVMQTIMKTVAKTDYDFFVVIDGTVDSAKDYAVSDGQNLFDEQTSFEAQNEKWIRKCVCPEDIEYVISQCKIENVWAKIKDGQEYKFSFSMKTDSGEIRRKQIQFTYIDCSRKSYLMSRIDVNDIYETQEKAKRKLQKALAAKSEFLSNMSHDMRTPMNAIIGFSEMGTDAQVPEETLRDYIQKINSSAHYLLNLINDVLDMAKIESNKIELTIEPVLASELFDSIIFSVKPAMDEKQIEFAIEVRNFIEGKCALIDKLRMQQIFINLLSNATKFTPPGGKIECIIESLHFDGRYSQEQIIIRDNGCGMSKEFMKKAFVPFEQEHTGNTPANSGTGLGLPIVKSLVDLMGGKITLKSEKNVGTEITINFTAELVDVASIPAKKVTAPPVEYDFSGAHVLLCEDHPLNCEIASKLLSKKGVFVDVAANGIQGLEKFKASGAGFYDAILMDIRMPDMDGLEATRTIRALTRPDAKTVPIIAMTANAFDDDIKMSLEAGMNAHLAKPIEPQRLYDTLMDLLQKEKREKNGAENKNI